MEILKIENEKYPKRLKEVQKPPKKLFIEGNINLLKNPSISIVGSRKCTEYGKKYAKEFAQQLSKKGITIISGLAIGIDTVAHISSMSEKGKTIAVIGSGFNNIYPKENKYLFKKILENGGCVITEYPPETEADMSKFPRRNQLISALSMGTLVIEAKFRSGSLLTAKSTIRYNKPVFCIPNRLGISTGVGTNLLIKNGANLVTDPKDIIEFFDYCLEEETENEDSEIYNLIGELPISINEIERETKKSISEIMEKLCILELEGKITNIVGNRYVRNYKK